MSTVTSWVAEHPLLVLCAVLVVIGALVSALLVIGFQRASQMPNAKTKTDVEAEVAAGETEQAKAQARAAKVLNAPDADVDDRVAKLRERGRSGK